MWSSGIRLLHLGQRRRLCSAVCTGHTDGTKKTDSSSLFRAALLISCPFILTPINHHRPAASANRHRSYRTRRKYRLRLSAPSRRTSGIRFVRSVSCQAVNQSAGDQLKFEFRRAKLQSHHFLRATLLFDSTLSPLLSQLSNLNPG